MPRRRSSSPPPLLSLPILIVIVPIFALLFLFFAVPPFLSVTSHIFRPYHTVKKSWDSLNIVLVLFAILCGVLARRNDDVSDTNQPVDENGVVVVDSDHKINDQTHSQQWFDQHYPERKVYDPQPEAVTAAGTRRLRRNSSSYPDLRQDSLWETGDDRFRFFDDFVIQHKFRSPAAVPENNNYGHLRRTRSDIEESQVKVIPVDTFVLHSTPPPKSPTPPPPPPPPPPAVSQKPRRTYQTVGRKERSKVETAPPPPPPPPPPRPAPPPPPPPPSQTGNQSVQKYVKLERKKSNATREIKTVLSSLYNQRKRKKKQKTKNISDYDEDSSFHSPREQQQSSTIPPPSPPPPPPPPPPPSVFHNLFRKSSKSKKVHSVPPPAPPPPPQRSSKRKGHAHAPPPPPPPAPPTPPRQPQPSRRRNAGKPPLPTRANNYLYDENNTMNISGGNQSPLNRMPPPPPPPPFQMAEPRFAVRGDFVSIHSSNSSRCSSPDHLEEVELSSTHHHDSSQKINNMTTDGGDNGGGGSGSVFCPSPDVNAKADNFIAKLRDGWRLERDNSIKEKRNTGLHLPI